MYRDGIEVSAAALLDRCRRIPARHRSRFTHTTDKSYGRLGITLDGSKCGAVGRDREQGGKRCGKSEFSRCARASQIYHATMNGRAKPIRATNRSVVARACNERRSVRRGVPAVHVANFSPANLHQVRFAHYAIEASG